MDRGWRGFKYTIRLSIYAMQFNVAIEKLLMAVGF
jgi:hypothetical protein